MPSVIALFRYYNEAERAIERLHAAGLQRPQISVIIQKRVMLAYLAQRDRQHQYEHLGRIHADTLSKLTGLLVGQGATAVPGMGALLAVGPLATAVDSAAGGLVTEFEIQGLPPPAAKAYRDGLKDGLILVAVHGEQLEAVEQILAQAGAEQQRRLERLVVGSESA